MNWKFITISVIIIIALIFTAIYFYQTTRFNALITINNIKVGGLTADQALKKLESSVLKNEVYVGKERIFDGKDTKMGFTKEDLPSVKKLLGSQWTFLPSSKAKNYSLMPSQGDQYRSQTLKKLLEDKLTLMNESLKAPQDADVRLENGNIIISNSTPGTQYDVANLITQYQKQEYTSEIHLKPIYLQPNKEDSPLVTKKEKMLQDFLQQTVDYKVQDKVYSVKGSDVIKNASLSKDMQVVFDPADIKNKVSEINSSQSTLNKNFSFKTHSGSVISVKGESYGWALDVDKETKLIQEAFEKGEKSISAEAIYGDGWSTYGTGYQTTTNNGIGDTYAEVSIAEQRIWIYKNGQLMVTTNVVTGWHGVDQDTPPGVWYIEFKRSPSILRGSEVGNPNYEVPVTYWAPFTLSGCGFHDAGWRRNWAGDAYLTQGSGGCVNVPPSVMASVYDNLVQNEPVVIY
ncbi:L,D-transpeptidase family protein [Neobacillus massiliamazoniensis]|nr:L,D-transpeptidase family protein [Neobacillus massiliamazoniensis]